jgi:hypothetical protein
MTKDMLAAMKNAQEIDEPWRPILARQRCNSLLDDLMRICAKHRARIYLRHQKDSAHWPTIAVEFTDNFKSYEQLEIDGSRIHVFDKDNGMVIERYGDANG